MDVQFKKWMFGLCYALVVLVFPAMSQDQNQLDSMPVKELVIATINASQPDTNSLNLSMPENRVKPAAAP